MKRRAPSGEVHGARHTAPSYALTIAVTRRSEPNPDAAAKSHCLQQMRGGNSMVIKEFGYLLLTLAGVAVLLFCWLGYASLSGPRRDK